MRGALLLLTSTLATAAAAQPFDAGTRLLLSEGPLRGSPRVMGLAGAYVGVADNAEGVTRNPAAAASKNPHFEHALNPDFGFAFHFLPPSDVSTQDWDNDGRPEGGPGPRTSLGTEVVYGVAALQSRAFGLALGVDAQNFPERVAATGYNLTLVHVFGALGVSLLDDSLLLGAGVESTQAVLASLENRALQDTLFYAGWGLTFGALWRPAAQDWRVGFSFRPGVTADKRGTRVELGGLVPPAAVVAPTRLSVGGSWALGDTGRRYNITSRDGWAAIPGIVQPSPALVKLLLTAQLDVTFPVAGATSVAGFLEQGAQPAPVAGDRPTFTLRVGAEKEVLPELLRLRLGGFLEPPTVATGQLRPHLTFGFESYVLTLPFVDKVGLGMSFDFAHAYQNISVGPLFWR